MNLVEDWKTWHKRWSVWLGTLATTLSGWLLLFPDSLQMAWNSIPIELRSVLPPKFAPAVAIALFVLSMLAQLVKQKKLQPPGDGDV